jgi:SAM-dependent methyltransferase
MHSSVERDIALGRIVCPVSRVALRVEGDTLVGPQRVFHRTNGVPMLLEDEEAARAYVQSSASMTADYAEFERPGLMRRLADAGAHDYRSKASNAAFARLFAGAPPDATFLSIGGGPTRSHPELINLNVGPFANVDIVGDAYHLPYADASVDGIDCQAVLEHLADPHAAISEMHRVLRPGGKAFVATPFMQGFHGYPSHFQNYTVIGHQELFKRHGFTVLDAGVAVGPAYALTAVVSFFLSSYLPSVLGFPLRALWFGVKQIVKPLDIWLNQHPNAHVLASLVYALVEKSVAPSKSELTAPDQSER